MTRIPGAGSATTRTSPDVNTVEYHWDSQDRLTKVNNNGTIAEYKYDLMGRRVAKKVGAGSWKC